MYSVPRTVYSIPPHLTLAPSHMPHLYLLGYPLTHSRSPEIQNAALREAGLHDWRYELLPTPSADLPQAVARLRQADCAGGNVTIPHKEAIIPLLDALTPAAQAIGAVNTLFKREGQLWGDNTDAEGFWLDLQHAFGNLLPGEALLLGAGGAARAVAYALSRRGWHVTIAARRVEQAENLCRDLAPAMDGALRPLALDALQSAIVNRQSALLIVNCTPLGMYPHVETSPWPPEIPFLAGARLYDLVYNPEETRLMQQARAAGLPAINGLGMLHAQAALAFRRWTDDG
ncbi:MAG: shikimate dehydrogenase [Anaerolineales bacterium]